MYNENDLKKYEYFYKILENDKIEHVLDPLTGLVNKGYFLPFIDSLIKDKIPFTLGIIDLDNFKFIIDNYGHTIGDEIINHIANDLTAFMGENGIVGRFGGDEFIFVCFKLQDYNEIHNTLSRLYVNVLRKTIRVSGLSIFVTATTGCATYPSNALTTSDLFDLADKTLFRGKMKGRNCYIIYVEKKHKDLKIEPQGANDIFKIVFGIKEKFQTKSLSLEEKITNAADFIKKNMNIPILLYIDTSGNIFNTEMQTNIGRLSTRIDLDNYNLYEINSHDDLKHNMDLYDSLLNINIESLVLTEINTKGRYKGYLVFADRKHKFWTPDEKTALFYIAEAIANE